MSDSDSVRNQLKDFREEIKELRKEISEFRNTVKEFEKSLDPEKYFLNELKDKFNNEYFSENTIRGKGEITTHFAIGRKGYNQCPYGDKFPHKFHSMDPQLNNIQDMLLEVYRCTCGDERKELDKKLEEMIKEKQDKQPKKKDCNKCEILDQLLDKLTKPKEKDHCLTKEEMTEILKELKLQKEESSKKLKIPLFVDF